MYQEYSGQHDRAAHVIEPCGVPAELLFELAERFRLHRAIGRQDTGRSCALPDKARVAFFQRGREPERFACELDNRIAVHAVIAWPSKGIIVNE